MSYLPMVIIITAAAQPDANLVWEARGRGPGSFMRKVCALDPGATWETTPTHYVMSDATATDGEVAICQAMTAGDLPPLPEGVVWGEDGIVSAADAMAATDGAVMQVYSVAGAVEPLDHIAGIFAGRGLQFVPDPPL